MANKKKLATSVAAVATAAAVLLGGTFAWQSISQTALNEASDVVNPGGRLHNDMWYVSETENNNDIYVENFGEEPIVARVRLSEYMEVVLNYGTNGELEKQLIGTKTVKNGVSEEEIAASPNGADLYDYQYRLFTDYTDTVEFAAGNDGENEPYWTWTTGGETVYMPTFNMNKDSLEADLYGLYADRVGGISNRVAAQYLDNDGVAITGGYADGEALPANAIYDYDSNTSDELANNGVDISTLIYQQGTDAGDYADNVKLVSESHAARPTLNARLISMSDWLTMVEDYGEYDAATHGGYWVYDEDGWVYWSAPIDPDSATGLLLNGITLAQVMDDTWYYAIKAEGQFVTLDDAGKGDGTGFYDTQSPTSGTAPYTVPTSEAEEMLQAMGVTLDGESGGSNFTPRAGTLNGMNMSLYFDSDYISVDEENMTITVLGTEESNWVQGEMTLSGENLPEGLTVCGTTNALYMMVDGGWVEEDTDPVDIKCYIESTESPEPLVDINCTTSADGTYKIVSTYTDSEGNNVWEGSLEFTIVSVEGEGGGEEGGDFYNTVALNHDGDSDTLNGGEFLIFDATVYNDAGVEIAYTDGVDFSVQEIMADDVATMAMFETTYMDDNALFVADDIVERGVKKVLVTARYRDEDETEYTGTYELDVRAGDSPLKIGLTYNGNELALPSGEDTYQFFPPDPSANSYNFTAKYNDVAVSTTTWSLEADEGWYTVGVEEAGYCYAYATYIEDDPETEDHDEENYDWHPDGVEPVKTGDKIARINTATGEFEVLLKDAFPYSLSFYITADCEVEGESVTNTVSLFFGRVVANFNMLNADEEPDSVDSHYATYTKDKESTINLAFDLMLNGEEAEVDVGELYDWVLRENDGYGPGGTVIDRSKYTITTDTETNTVKLTIPANSITFDGLSLEVKYNHGVLGPRTPDGISKASLSIAESSTVSTGEGEVDRLEIMNEWGEESTTYTKGEYQKIRLEAYPYTADGDEVYSGSVVWSIPDCPENVKLKQDGFTAEVWLLKAEAEAITVQAYYYKENEEGVKKNDTFTITAYDGSGGEYEDGNELTLSFAYSDEKDYVNPGQTVTLSAVTPEGDEPDEVTFSLDGEYADGTYIEGNTLHVSNNETQSYIGVVASAAGYDDGLDYVQVNQYVIYATNVGETTELDYLPDSGTVELHVMTSASKEPVDDTAVVIEFEDEEAAESAGWSLSTDGATLTISTKENENSIDMKATLDDKVFYTRLYKRATE